MKNILILLLWLCSINAALYAQEKQVNVQRLTPDMYPYGREKHSIEQHANFLATNYWLTFRLNRKQRNELRDAIITVYRTPFPALGNVVDEQQRQVMESQRIHHVIEAKLKELLSAEQYGKYTQCSFFPEIFWASVL